MLSTWLDNKFSGISVSPTTVHFAVGVSGGYTVIVFLKKF